MTWFSSGCEECRSAALRGMQTPLVKLGASLGPIFLYRCNVCGSYWEENLREAHVISEAEARESFPDVFASSASGQDA
jgi:hypothetical protein